MAGEDAQDDRSRFQGIYEAHYGAVVAYARRRCTDPVDVQDAVAETFTIAWRRLREVPAEAALPWLYGVARRVMANQRRGNRRRADLSVRLRGDWSGAVEIGDAVLAEDEHRTVLGALGRLRQADQEVLRLAVWEELSHRDIARILGCSEPAVAVKLHRARNRLGREIEKEIARGGQEDQRGGGQRPEGENP